MCDFMLNMLFLAGPIILVYQQIFQFSTLSILHFLAPEPKVEKDYYEILISEIIFWVCSSTVSFLLPLICFIIVFSSEKRLNNEIYEDIFGVLFVNLKHGSSWHLMHNIIFIYRRISVVFLAIYV